MSSTRPLKIFQRTRSSSRRKPIQSSNPHPKEIEFDTCYALPALEDDESEPEHEIFDESESEEQKANITFQSPNQNDSSSSKLPTQSSSQKPSNDSISSVAELNKIISEIKKPNNHKNPESKMPKRRKRICKNPQGLDSVRVGEFFVGRLKKRNRIKPKVTLNDVDEIYRCQCGKDYLSYMGIYRHIKTVHLQKDQYQLFKLHTFRDHQNGKTIKTVIIEQSAKPLYNKNDRQNNRNMKATVENQHGNIILERPNIKLEDCKLEDLDLSLNYDQAINQSRELSQAQDLNVPEPTVSLSKYEKLIEDYHRILNQRFEKEKEHFEVTRKLMQENSILYQAKEKYKLKLKLLEAKLQAQMIRLEGNDSAQQQAPQQKSAEAQQHENTLFEFSASQSLSCSLPRFSTLNLTNSSEYGSSIEQVFSLGLKSQSNRESSNLHIQNRIEPLKGLNFDPEASENRTKVAIMKKHLSFVKQEEEIAGSIQTQNLSGKTSQKTPYFKGCDSDTQTEYDEYENENGQAKRFKSESYSMRSMRSL